LAGGFLPYGRQTIDEADIAAVVEALKADFLTTGPRVEAFEAALARAVGAPHAVVCSNATAALHLAMASLDVGPGDVCVVPSMTFLATANCVRFQGAEVVFADVDPDTGLITQDTLHAAMDRAPRRPSAILPVHLAGRVADMPALAEIAGDIPIVEDACHALGSESAGACVHSAMACFSFHPVKMIASGEGGAVTTRSDELAQRLRRLRSHGMVRPEGGDPWWYEQQELGWNYRLPDILCALGHSQLSKLDTFAARRRDLAARYDALLAPLAPLLRVTPREGKLGLHLYVALIDFEAARVSRRTVVERLAARGIGSQVHYIPVHRQPYYTERYGHLDLPGAVAWYARCLSLPLFPAMTDEDPARVVEALIEALKP